MEIEECLYVFSCTAYLVTPHNLVTVFWQTKCVTKSRLHCNLLFFVKSGQTQIMTTIHSKWSWLNLSFWVKINSFYGFYQFCPKVHKNSDYCLIMTHYSNEWVKRVCQFYRNIGNRNVFSVKLSRICWLNGAKRCKCALIWHPLWSF